jgi:hypothetical protein
VVFKTTASTVPPARRSRIVREARTYFRSMGTNVPEPSEPERRRPLTGVASVVMLIALGVLFLPGPDVWRYLGGTLFVVAAAVLIIGMDR